MIIHATKKPTPVTAVIWNGDGDEIYQFYGDKAKFIDSRTTAEPDRYDLDIETPFGIVPAGYGDYIVKDVINGGFFPCKPEVFNLIYDKQEKG